MPDRKRTGAQRKVRVITTDKIAPPVVSAIEQEPVRMCRVMKTPRLRRISRARKTTDLAPGETMPAAAARAPWLTEHQTYA